MEVLNSKFIAIRTHIENALQESIFEIRSQTVPELDQHDVLVKCLYVSINPYQINRMKAQSSPQNSVAGASKINPGMTINCGGMGRVVASKHPNYQENDIVYGSLNWAEYIVKNGDTLKKLDTMEFPLSYHLGIFGKQSWSKLQTLTHITSANTHLFTAHGGFFQICKPKKEDKVFVSAAAGSVGNLVGQYAKLFGCYVVGSAGTNQKVDLLKEKLGFDEAFNYKKETDLKSTLQRYFPDGIDIYFDNVGGEMLEAVIANMNAFGRIAACGAISSYINSGKGGHTTLSMVDVIYKRIMIRGFLCTDFSTNDYNNFMSMTRDYVRAGKLCVLEDISCGIESIPSAFVGLFRGDNVGKKIVQIAKE